MLDMEPPDGPEGQLVRVGPPEQHALQVDLHEATGGGEYFLNVYLRQRAGHHRTEGRRGGGRWGAPASGTEVDEGVGGGVVGAEGAVEAKPEGDSLLEVSYSERGEMQVEDREREREREGGS